MTRARLPSRRASETFDFDHVSPTGKTEPYTTTLGFHDNGDLGEFFLNSRRIGTDLDVAVKDAAILLSIALQHGCPLETLRAAMTRDAKGRAEGVIGTLLDILATRPGPEPEPAAEPDVPPAPVAPAAAAAVPEAVGA